MTHTEAIQTSAAERYLLDEMSEPERFAFEDHYFACEECADDVRMGAVMRDAAKGGLVKADVVSLGNERVRREKRTAFGWRTAALPWAAAAALALVVGYQAVAPDRRPLQPQALVPVTLRPESRGAEPVVPLGRDSSVVTLALDTGSAQATDITYDLRANDGQSVASGTLAPPAPGAPLLLLVPAWTLRPDGHYILGIHRAADGELLAEYRFQTSTR